MKAKVISQPNKEGTPSRSSGYLVPIALSLLSTTLAQCVEAAVVNKNLLFSAEEIRIFSNESADLSVKDKVLLENYTVNASLLLNPLNEVGTLNFSPKDTNVYQYKGKSNDGAVNTVEFALTDVVVNDELGNQNSTKTPIISFRNDNVDPIKGEFDVSIKSFLFDTQLPGSVVRSETKDHTIITFQGADLNKKNTPFMIIVLDKLPADANINKALQDANLVKEVTIINSVTGESIDIPQNQDQVISTQQTSAPPSLVDLIGIIIEPSEVVQAQGLPTNTPEPTAIPVPMIEVGGLQIPDPKASNPELFDVINPDSPIVQFANAFLIKPEDITQGIFFETHTDSKGNQYVIARYNLNPDPNTEGEPFEKPIVFIGKQEQDGSWSWHNNQDISNGVLFGDEFKIGTVMLPHLDSTDIQVNNFNAATITYVWKNREKIQGMRDTSYVDRQLQLAKLGTSDPIRLSHVISCEKNSEPDWLKEIDSNEALEQALKDQIRFAMKTYSAQGVTEFNVLNEPYPAYSYLANRLGRDHLVTLVFEEANLVRDEIINKAKANNKEVPVIKLGFSNSENHFANGVGTSPTLQIIEMLAEKGWIDFVDVHFHVKDIKKAPSAEDVSNTVKKYGEIVNQTTGKPIEVVIGEMDFNIAKLLESDSKRQLEKGTIGYEYFRRLFDLGVREITFWGAIGSDSWYENGQFSKDSNADALLFNDNGSPEILDFALNQAIIETLLH